MLKKKKRKVMISKIKFQELKLNEFEYIFEYSLCLVHK